MKISMDLYWPLNDPAHRWNPILPYRAVRTAKNFETQKLASLYFKMLKFLKRFFNLKTKNTFF